MDPHHQDARSQQWNVEIQRQMGANLAASVGYIGRKNDRFDLTGLFNTNLSWSSRPRGLSPIPGRSSSIPAAAGGSTQKTVPEEELFRVSKTTTTRMVAATFSSYDMPQFLSMSGVWELPFGRSKQYLSLGIVSQVLGNWQLNGVVQLRSRQPYNLAVAGDAANIGNTSFANYARPNIVGDPNPAHRTLNEWFNPNAFAVPSFSYGDFGRNGLRWAPVYNADFSLFNNLPVGERFLVSFRAEFLNAFNIQNYSPPSDTSIGVAGAGQVTSNVLPPRQIQFGLHLGL
jgi:hypothetical protein